MCLLVFCYCFFFVARFCLLFVSGFFHKDLSAKNNNTLVKSPKTPSWSQAQLKEAISCILTQQMRFTQASAKFKIPKGTLYDNILGQCFLTFWVIWISFITIFLDFYNSIEPGWKVSAEKKNTRVNIFVLDWRYWW